MENASKALIIAGAILLAILLISLGIMIFNQAQSAIDGSGMSDAQLTAFNQKWTKYEGAQKGSTIRSMVQEVLANNTSGEASDETRIAINDDIIIGTTTIRVSGGNSALVKLSSPTASNTNPQPTFGSNFSNTKTYNVSFTYQNGRIVIIKIA